MFSCDIEISMPVYVKAPNISWANKILKEGAGDIGVHVQETKVFSDKSFQDPTLGRLTFATAFTAQGLWKGTTLKEIGITSAPNTEDEPKAGSGLEPPITYVMFAGTARVAETIYIKAPNKKEANKRFSEIRGKQFRFEEDGCQVFHEQPLGIKGASAVSFGSTFKVHGLFAGNRFEDRGECPSGTPKASKNREQTSKRSKSWSGRFSHLCAPDEALTHLHADSQTFQARPIFRGLDITFVFNPYGDFVCEDGASARLLPSVDLALIKELVKEQLADMFQRGDEVRLNCKISECDGLKFLDPFRITAFVDGRPVSVRIVPPTLQQQPSRPMLHCLQRGDLNVGEILFQKSSVFVMEYANKNPSLWRLVDAILWIPDSSEHSFHAIEIPFIHQVVSVDDVKQAQTATRH